jgi:hypothetical protein
LFFTFARSFLKKKFCFFNLCPEGALYEGSRGEDAGKGSKKQKCYLCKQRGSKSKILFFKMPLPLRGSRGKGKKTKLLPLQARKQRGREQEEVAEAFYKQNFLLFSPTGEVAFVFLKGPLPPA